jgi:hypothetical protein
MDVEPDSAILIPKFTLADQLTVDPSPLPRADDETRARKIEMTRQEVAVALSRVEVWKLISDGDVPSAPVALPHTRTAAGSPDHERAAPSPRSSPTPTWTQCPCRRSAPVSPA